MTEERAIEILGNCRGCIHLSGNKCIADGRCFAAKEFAIKALQEIEQYRSIGTVSDCQKATEKQRAKKITHEATIYRCCTCPNCKNVVDEFETFRERKVRVTFNYCHFCGQKLDWSNGTTERLEAKR